MEELFTKYWSQVAFLLLGIGFLIKKLLDNFSKKMEINHSLYQERKLEAVNRFFKNYSRIEQCWIELPIYEVLRHEVKPKELDSIQFPLISNLKSNVLELKIYFKKDEHQHFQEILSNCFKVKATLSDAYLNYKPNEELTERSNNFILMRERVFELNNKLIEKVTVNIRSSYK